MDLIHPAALALLTDLLAQGGRVRFTVTGESMRPSLAGGMTVVLEPAALAALHLGDLVLIHHREPVRRLLLHRIVRLRRHGRAIIQLQTQGDALAWPDAPMEADGVLGRVVACMAPETGVEQSLVTWRMRARARGIAWRQRVLALGRRIIARRRH